MFPNYFQPSTPHARGSRTAHSSKLGGGLDAPGEPLGKGSFGAACGCTLTMRCCFQRWKIGGGFWRWPSWVFSTRGSKKYQKFLGGNRIKRWKSMEHLENVSPQMHGLGWWQQKPLATGNEKAILLTSKFAGCIRMMTFFFRRKYENWLVTLGFCGGNYSEVLVCFRGFEVGSMGRSWVLTAGSFEPLRWYRSISDRDNFNVQRIRWKSTPPPRMQSVTTMMITVFVGNLYRGRVNAYAQPHLSNHDVLEERQNDAMAFHDILIQ